MTQNKNFGIKKPLCAWDSEVLSSQSDATGSHPNPVHIASK